MELSKEYFDQQIKNLATKQDLDDLRDELKNHTSDAIAELAEHINETIAIPLTKHLQQTNHWPIKL